MFVPPVLIIHLHNLALSGGNPSRILLMNVCLRKIGPITRLWIQLSLQRRRGVQAGPIGLKVDLKLLSLANVHFDAKHGKQVQVRYNLHILRIA